MANAARREPWRVRCGAGTAAAAAATLPANPALPHRRHRLPRPTWWSGRCGCRPRGVAGGVDEVGGDVAGGGVVGSGVEPSGRRSAHCPSAPSSTRLASPTGAGVLPVQSRFSSKELPEISNPPVLPMANMPPWMSLFTISSRERLRASRMSPSMFVPSMVVSSPTSSSSRTLPSIRLRSMAMKSARLV